MFTFSPGFEAATLKIPNKEYTAYNGVGPGRNFQGYNDPYNLMTINSGGVLVDGGREGTMASWPASMPPDESNPHFVPGIVQPRKQIIGFAKFRSREAALEARDVLQGRRIDIEKGAVLKAEMAKKNLHTKRGVGPLPNNGAAVNGNNIPVNNPPPINHGANLPTGTNMGLGYGVNGVLGAHPPPPSGENFSIPSNEQFYPREREPLTPVGRLAQWRDPVQVETQGVPNLGHLTSPTSRERDDDERRRGVLDAMGFGVATRGPRERAAEEEKRKELRLRGNNTAAYDAFHSVPAPAPPGLSRQTSNISGLNGGSLLPPEAESGAGQSLGSSPSLSHGFVSPFPGSHSNQTPQALSADEAIGPWDKINKAIPARSISGSQRSSSPPDAIGATDGQPGNRHTPMMDDNQIPYRQVFPEDTGSSGGLQSPDSAQADLSQKIDSLALSTANGNISPQLPSPASGASSSSTRNAVDQNPPVCHYIRNLARKGI